VGDHLDLGGGGLVDVPQEPLALLRHHHEPGRELDELPHHAPLIGVGVLQHGVQGGHDGDVHLAQEGEQVAAGRPSEDAELVLDADHVDVADAQEVRRPAVGARFCSSISKRTSGG